MKNLLFIILMIQSVSVFAMSAKKEKNQITETEISKEQAITIVQKYEAYDVGCGGISKEVTETKDHWVFDGKFGFTGAEKKVKVSKADGAVYVDDELKVKDYKTLK